ncbi:MAG: caspase family protein [Phycisphaerales bacterium]
MMGKRRRRLQVIVLVRVLASAFLAAISAAVASARPPGDTTKTGRLYDRVHVVSIGVQFFASPYIPPVDFADADALEVADLLETRYGYGASKLVGPMATRDGILAELDRVANEAGPNDAIIVFYAGHGATVTPEANEKRYQRQGYIIPFDAEIEDFANPSIDEFDREAISMNEFADRVMDCDAKHVLLLMDCCYSGVLASVSDRSVGKGERSLVRQLLREPTRQVITAGTATQQSFSSMEYGHGVFTYALLEQLREGELLPVTDLFAPLYRRVIDISAEHNRELRPRRHAITPSDGDWVFIYREHPEYDTLLVDSETNATPARTGDERSLPAATSEEEYREVRRQSTREASSKDLSADPEWVARRQEYEERAANGDPYALALMQHFYAIGVGVEKDEETSFHYAADAYDTQTSIGHEAVADCYEDGIGVRRDEAVANELRDQALILFASTFATIAEDRELNPDDALAAGFTLATMLAQREPTIRDRIGSIMKERDRFEKALDSDNANSINRALKKWERAISDLESEASQALDDREVGGTQRGSNEAIQAACRQLRADVVKIREAESMGLRQSMRRALAAADESLEAFRDLLDS